MHLMPTKMRAHLESTWGVALAFIIYLFLSLIYWLPPNGDLAGQMVSAGGGRGGNGTFVWILQWWPYAILHGLNPIIENYTWFHPQNLTWAAENISPAAILLAPITLLFGPIVAYNIMALLAAPLAAFTMFLLLRRITGKPLPSLVGGYVFGYSSYMVGELIGHPNLYLVFLLPIAVLCCFEFYRGRLDPWKFVLFLGVTTLLLFLTSLEIFASATFFAAMSWLVAVLMLRGQRVHLVRLAKYIVVSYLCAIAALAPAIYYLIVGLHSIPAVFNPPTLYSADALNYFIPTPITLVGGHTLSSLAKSFPGNYMEEGAYLGLPIILAIMIYIIRTWPETVTRMLSVILIVLVISSLGPIVHIGGIKVLAGPWLPFSHLPVLRNALPTRFVLFVSFCAAVLVALFLCRYHRYVSAYVLVIVGLCCLVPNVHAGYWKSQVPRSSFFDGNAYKTVISPNSYVLVLPFSYNGSGMLFDALDHFYYRLNDGFIGRVPNSIFRWPLLVQTFYDHQAPLPGFRHDLMCYLWTTNVSDVIVMDGQHKIYGPYLKGLPDRTFGRVKVYQVGRSALANYRGCEPASVNTVVRLLQSRSVKGA